jgi:hypothetical protein
MRARDFTGHRFGILTVIKFAGKRRGKSGYSKRFWLCRCDCGKTKEIFAREIDRQQSCGCLHYTLIAKKLTKHGYARQGNQKPEYRVWHGMLDRCTNKHCKSFRNYGDRGITVSDEWLDFKTFISDMGDRPSKKHTIERKNNELGYSKDNCYWALRSVQSRNRRNNRWIEHGGEKMCITDWSRKLGITLSALQFRLKHWEIGKALATDELDTFKGDLATKAA